MKTANLFLIGFLLIIGLTACGNDTVQSSDTEPDSSIPAPIESSTPELLSFDEDIELPEVVEPPPSLSPEVYTQLALQSRWYPPSVIIAVDGDGVKNFSILGGGFVVVGTWEDYLVGYGVGETNTITYHMPTGNLYNNELLCADDLRIFSNGVIALMFHQDLSDEYDHNVYRHLLIDMNCVPLNNQLQFDFGDREHLFGHEYQILNLAYQAENDNYVAIFSRNPRFGMDRAENYNDYDNTVCQLGIVIFDGNGNQLERYELNGEVYPVATIRKSILWNVPPLLYPLEKNVVLIVPQVSEESAYAKPPDDTSVTLVAFPLEGYSSAPILLNLSTRSFQRLSDDEMLSLLDDDNLRVWLNNNRGYWERRELFRTQYGYLNQSGAWESFDLPFVFQQQGDDFLVYGENQELPLFALPPNYGRLTLYHEYDGVHYLMFK